MNDLFKRVLDTYIDGEKYDNKDKEYHEIICHSIPQYIKEQLNDEKYIVKGSCGVSYKTDIPWIGVFNSKITESAQKGLYIVYLFKADMTGFYMCLGQGVTNFQKYGKNKDEYMVRVAQYFKGLTDTYIFSKDSIDLNSNVSRGEHYNKANVLQKYYDKEKIDEYNFEEDLRELIKIYDQIYRDMNELSYEQVIENILSQSDLNYINANEATKMIDNALHEDSEQYEFDSGRILEEIAIPKVTKIIYGRISRSNIKKIDHIKKAKKDAAIGLDGEKLVLEYEKEKFRKKGRVDLIEKIDWVGSYDESKGYDIRSYEIDENGDESEIFIEVKTTEDGENTQFFMSENEIKTMKENKKKYWIYRVCRTKNKPIVYRVSGKEFERYLKATPYTYLVELR